MVKSPVPLGFFTITTWDHAVAFDIRIIPSFSNSFKMLFRSRCFSIDIFLAGNLLPGFSHSSALYSKSSGGTSAGDGLNVSESVT